MDDFRRLFPYLKPYIPMLLVALLLLTLAGALEVFITSLAAPMFDGVLTAPAESGPVMHEKFAFIYNLLGLDEHNIVKRIALALIVLTFLKGLCLYFSNYSMSYVGNSVVLRLRNALYRHIIAQSIEFLSFNPTGRLMAHITSDAERLQEAVSVTAAEFVRETILLLFLVGYVFYIDWKLTLLALLIAPVALFSTVHLGRRIRRASGRSQEHIAEISTVLQETITGHRIVKAFGMERLEMQKFLAATKRLLRANLKSAKIMFLSSPLMEFLGVLCFIPLLVYVHGSIAAGLQRGRGGLTLGAFSAFLFAIFRLYDPIRKLSRIHIQFQQAFAASARVFAVLDTPVTVADKPAARTLPGVRERIEFKNVCFDYTDHTSRIRALKNINLTARVGQVVALVGSSGAGKSTLVNLLPRFYDITSGSIAIDGIDIRDLTLASLRAHISIVAQETFLFNDTARNNIAYGRADAREVDIIAAAKAALSHDFIVQLPQGYDTVIGERGHRLSGGERQRISIARAILKDAPILILDEATSALDSESEKLVQAALLNLIKDRTTFVIAHRLSTIRLADVIVVLDDGQIREIGTHKTLLEGNGIYRRLHELQFADVE